MLSMGQRILALAAMLFIFAVLLYFTGILSLIAVPLFIVLGIYILKL